MAVSSTDYELLHVGVAGPKLDFGDAMRKPASDIAEGKPIAGKIPKRIMLSMAPPKNQRRIVDFFKAWDAMVVSERVKEVFEAAGPDGVELFKATIRDHGKKTVPDAFYVVNVVKSIPYFDIKASSIEYYSELMWTISTLVVDKRYTGETPPLFRLGPSARYCWYFLRSDIARRLEAMRATGWRTTPVAELARGSGVESL